MIRRPLARVGAAFAILAGLTLAYLGAYNGALSAGLFAPPGPLSGPGPSSALSLLQIISLPLLPLGMLFGIFGLVVLLGMTSVVRWGIGLAVGATLLLIVEPFVSYFFWIGSNHASPGYDAITALFILTRALSLLSSLVLAAALMLFFVAARRDRKLGAWGVLLPVLAIATVLSSTGPLALSAGGLSGDVMLSGIIQLVTGLLWVALGVALWRRAPEYRNFGTTPLIS